MVDELNVKFTMSQGKQVKILLSVVARADWFYTVKCLFRQVLEGIDYLHMNDIIHRYV